MLQRSTADVHKLGIDLHFVANRALLISYIDVSAYISPSSLRHTFQLVLATDGNITYAILNYQRLDRISARVGYSEGLCNSRSSPSFDLLRTSNVGVKGRHVYKLTNYECFKPLKGINTFSTGVFLFSFYGTTSVTMNINMGVINHLSKNVFVEFVSLMHPAMSFVTLTRAQSSFISIGISYTTSFYPSIHQLQSMVIHDGTSSNAEFQYGNKILKQFSSSINCQRIYFSTKMTKLPSIKLTGDVGTAANSLQRHASLWLRHVSSLGFDVCFKEVVAFSGTKNISVNYIALSGSIYNFTEYGSIHFSKRSDSICKRMQFSFEYIKTPYVFTTPEEVMNKTGGGALISWVKSINFNYADICAKSSEEDLETRENDMKVNYIIQGVLSPCSYVSCPYHLQCRLNYLNEPYCGCIQQCQDLSNTSVVCSTDFETYQSECYIHKTHCEKYGNTTRSEVKVAHMGKCESKSQT